MTQIILHQIFQNINPSEPGTVEVLERRIRNMDPLQALLEGQRLVRGNKLTEGIAHLQFALNEFMHGIRGKDSDNPELYRFADDCYLFMMSASFGRLPLLNLELTNQRREFHQRYNVEERIKNAKYPAGYVMLKGESL